MKKKQTDKLADEVKKGEVDYKKLAKAISTANTTTTTNPWHTTYPSTSYPSTTYPTQPIYTPQVSTPLPHFNLGSEADNQELLAMIAALGVEPTEDYLGLGIKIVIGDKWYSFTELLVKQMQFMARINILLCDRGTDGKD